MEPIAFFYTIWTTIYFLHDAKLLLIRWNNFLRIDKKRAPETYQCNNYIR